MDSLVRYNNERMYLLRTPDDCPGYGPKHVAVTHKNKARSHYLLVMVGKVCCVEGQIRKLLQHETGCKQQRIFIHAEYRGILDCNVKYLVKKHANSAFRVGLHGNQDKAKVKGSDNSASSIIRVDVLNEL
jgi:hypothetical protein